MRKLTWVFFIIMLLIGTAITTNPTKEDYINYIKDECIKTYDESDIEKALATYAIPAYVDQNTTEKDYVLFSVFNDKTGGEHIVLGAFKNFFPLDRTSK